VARDFLGCAYRTVTVIALAYTGVSGPAPAPAASAAAAAIARAAAASHHRREVIFIYCPSSGRAGTSPAAGGRPAVSLIAVLASAAAAVLPLIGARVRTRGAGSPRETKSRA